MLSSARVFRALADPTRREILHVLKEGEMAAGEIAGRFEISGPSVSRHLAILLSAELVESRREGNRIFYALCAGRLAEVLGDFLSSVCPTQVVRRMRGRKKRG